MTVLWIRIGSASFCWIRIWIGIQGMPKPIPFRPIRIGINSKQKKKLVKEDFFLENFNMWSKILKTYDTVENDAKDKTLRSDNAET
jgi:hypothetical protein